MNLKLLEVEVECWLWQLETLICKMKSEKRRRPHAPSCSCTKLPEPYWVEPIWPGHRSGMALQSLDFFFSANYKTVAYAQDPLEQPPTSNHPRYYVYRHNCRWNGHTSTASYGNCVWKWYYKHAEPEHVVVDFTPSRVWTWRYKWYYRRRHQVVAYNSSGVAGDVGFLAHWSFNGDKSPSLLFISKPSSNR